MSEAKSWHVFPVLFLVEFPPLSPSISLSLSLRLNSFVFDWPVIIFVFCTPICSDLVARLGDGGRRRGRLLPRAKPYHSRFQCGKLQVTFYKKNSSFSSTSSIRFLPPILCHPLEDGCFFIYSFISSKKFHEINTLENKLWFLFISSISVSNR